MALALFDRVQETTTTTGTGSITLAGAVAGFQSFAVVGNGNTCYYTIVDGSAWEVGIGTYSTTGPTLARTTILSNSNGNTTAITLAAGSKSVFLTYPAGKSVNLDASGNVSPLGTVASGTWQGSTVGVAYGGTGTSTPSLVAGTNITISGSFPNQTINASGGGLTQFTAAESTTAPNGTVYVDSLTAAAASANADVAFVAKGTGATLAQVPNSTTTGGNKRGTYATDWQKSRINADRVASGNFSVISGGYNNRAGASYAFIGAGSSNTVDNGWSAVVCGNNNAISGDYCFTGSGEFNSISSVSYSVVVGGSSNSASSPYAFVGGGANNAASTSATGYNVVVGGANNIASGTYSFVGGGGDATTAAYRNTASGSGSAVVGGQLNTASAINTFVGCGNTNTSSSNYSLVVGGTSNTASSGNAVVVGGGSNTASSPYSFVGGGSTNAAQTTTTGYNTVVGGANNIASGDYSFVGGGGDATTATNRNTASGANSAIVGGSVNTNSGNHGFLGGGNNNAVSGASYGTVGGGQSNYVGYNYGTVAGGKGHSVNMAYGAVMGGAYGNTRSTMGYHAFPACFAPISTVTGVSQGGLLILARQTTDATATVLTSENAAASTTNQVILPNNSAYYFRGSITAGVTGGGNSAMWSFEGGIKRGANAAATTLIQSVINPVAADSGASTWIVALSADTTNGGLAVTVTGQASTTIRWVCKIETTEMTF